MRVFHPLAAAALTLAAAGAHAVPLVGLTTANELALFDSASPAVAQRVSIGGLSAGERLVGIDTRPGNAMLYGISTLNRVYTLDAGTGMATLAATLSAPVIDPALGWGLDFNPVADFNGASSLRLVSSAGDNYAINADTGVVGNAANKIAPGFSSVAYSNSVLRPTGAPASTALYYIDSTGDRLAMAGSAFNTPTITTVGALGVDVLRAGGFELLGDGRAFAALNVDDGSLATGLYSIDLATGQAALVGRFDGTLAGLAVSPVPEPATWATMLLGLGGAALVRRRRRA